MVYDLGDREARRMWGRHFCPTSRCIPHASQLCWLFVRGLMMLVGHILHETQLLQHNIFQLFVIWLLGTTALHFILRKKQRLKLG